MFAYLLLLTVYDVLLFLCPRCIAYCQLVNPPEDIIAGVVYLLMFILFLLCIQNFMRAITRTIFQYRREKENLYSLLLIPALKTPVYEALLGAASN